MWAWVAKTTWYWKIQILQVGSRFKFIHYLLNSQYCLEIWMKSQEKQRYIHLFLCYKNSNSSNIDWDWLINLMLFYKHLISGSYNYEIMINQLLVLECARCWICHHPANIYFFKVNSENTRKRCEICSKLSIKPQDDVVSLLLTLNIFHTLF